MKNFAELIIKNLHSNGFPAKKVSLPTEKMYEVADNKGLSLNKVLEYLREEKNIEAIIEDEKIIFSVFQVETQNLDSSNPFDGMDPQELMKKAQEMMAQMDPAELQKIQEQFGQMSESEKASLMQQGKDMGII